MITLGSSPQQMEKQAVHDPKQIQEESAQAYATLCFLGFHK